MQGMPAPGEFTNSTLCQSPASRRERAFRPSAVIRQANTSVYFRVLLSLWHSGNSDFLRTCSYATVSAHVVIVGTIRMGLPARPVDGKLQPPSAQPGRKP